LVYGHIKNFFKAFLLKSIVIKFSGLLLIGHLIIWWLLFYSPLNFPERIPKTPINIKGLTLIILTSTIIIYFQRRALKKDNRHTTLRLVFFSTVVCFIAELLFQTIRFPTIIADSLSERLYYAVRGGIVIPILGGVISFIVALLIKTKTIQNGDRSWKYSQGETSNKDLQLNTELLNNLEHICELKEIADEQSFNEMIKFPRTIIYISVNWSGYERISRYIINSVLNGFKAIEIPIFKIDCTEQEKRYVEVWLKNQSASAQYYYSNGYGETLLVEHGQIVDVIRYPGELGIEKTRSKIEQWLTKDIHNVIKH
jgi:hypothetical protein